MYYDPYDENVQVKFYRTDPTGRVVPLGGTEAEARRLMWLTVCAALVVALTVWWLA